MTTTNSTATAAEKLQELNAKIDAAMTGKGPYTAAELQAESLAFCRLQGSEAGDVSQRLRALKEREESDGASVQLMDAMNWAEALLYACITMRVDKHMPPVPAALWQSGVDALENPRYSVEMRVSQMTRLNALLMVPEAMTHVVHGLRAALVEADPQLAPLAGDVTPLEHAADALSPVGDNLSSHVPLAVNHQIDGLGLELRPDGELTIEHPPQRLVRFTPREAYALLMFFRSPAVVALLEAQNAARMTASEIAFQNDPETIAERAAQERHAA